MEEPEPAVVQAAMDGDLAAFERLVRSYQAHVWRFLRHLLGDAALAEDVTQETFLRLYQRLPTFAGRSRFSTWVFRVARNAGVDALRAARRHDRLLAALRELEAGGEADVNQTERGGDNAWPGVPHLKSRGTRQQIVFA